MFDNQYLLKTGRMYRRKKDIGSEEATNDVGGHINNNVKFSIEEIGEGEILEKRIVAENIVPEDIKMEEVAEELRVNKTEKTVEDLLKLLRIVYFQLGGVEKETPSDIVAIEVNYRNALETLRKVDKKYQLSKCIEL